MATKNCRNRNAKSGRFQARKTKTSKRVCFPKGRRTATRGSRATDVERHTNKVNPFLWKDLKGKYKRQGPESHAFQNNAFLALVGAAGGFDQAHDAIQAYRKKGLTRGEALAKLLYG